MAELPADVTVKSEEAPPAAPAELRRPRAPERASARDRGAGSAAAAAADEAAQQPVALTPEQAAAAYAAQPDVQAAYAAAAAAYAAQPPQHYPQQQEVNRQIGQWTREEEAYAEKVAELFKTGRVPNCPEGTTMRALLADLLNCAPMRVSKKFSGERAIGKCSYKRSSADLDEEEAELKPLEQAFHDSVRGMGHFKMSLAHCSNLITPVAAKEQKRALRVQQQQGQHSADLAWSHAAAPAQRTRRTSTPCGASRRPITSRACLLLPRKPCTRNIISSTRPIIIKRGRGLCRGGRSGRGGGGRRGGSCGSSCGN